MPRTLDPRPPRAKYGSASAVTPTLARAEGRTPGGLHQELHGPVGAFAKVERYLQQAVAQGHVAWAATRVARLSRLIRRPAAPLTLQLVTAAQERDSAEDVAESRALMSRSTEDLEAWLRAKDRAMLADLAERDAIAAELDRRRTT